MADTGAAANPCGIDTVEIARIERLLHETAPADLTRFFSPQELADSGDGPGRAASLAARFAAKEACLKLFPREAAMGHLEPADFSVARDNYGAPQVVCAPKARVVLGLHRIKSIALSLTHDRVSASAVALAERAQAQAGAGARFVYRFLPLRRDGRAREPAPRVRRHRARGRDRAPRAGALRPPDAPHRRVPPLPLASPRRRSWRWCASRTSRRSWPPARRARAS